MLKQAAIEPSAVSLSVRVDSEFGLSAVASIAGHLLAEQHVYTSDRPLNRGAVDMLANAVAVSVSKFKHS